MRPPVGIGDVLRAWELLGATTDEERRAIARMLGFDLLEPSKPKPPDDPPPGGSDGSSRDPGGTTTTPSPRQKRSAVSVVPQELVPTTSARDVDIKLPAEAVKKPSELKRRPLPSLFAAQWARSIAHTLTARRAPLGAIDIARVIDDLVNQRPLDRMPRRDRLVSASEITAVIDRRATIAWFREDAEQLIERLNAVTRAPVKVVISDGAPSVAPAGAIIDSDEPFVTVVRADAGTRVVGITDLGLGSRWSAGDPARAEKWEEVARSLRTNGASLVIVTPVPLVRIPTRLRRMAACVVWDQRTRPAAIHRAVKEIR